MIHNQRFAIICDANEGFRLGISCLALVDRKISKKRWWTSDNPKLILGYRKRSAAEFACSRLKHNNPRVVSLEDAIRTISDQAKAISEHEIFADAEDAGWDAYKGSWH